MLIPTTDDITTVTDLRERTMDILQLLKKRREPTIIVHRNAPQSVMMSIERYNQLMEMLEDYSDAAEASEIIADSKSQKEKSYSLKEVAKSVGYKLKKGKNVPNEI